MAPVVQVTESKRHLKIARSALPAASAALLTTAM